MVIHKNGSNLARVQIDNNVYTSDQDFCRNENDHFYRGESRTSVKIEAGFLDGVDSPIHSSFSP